MVSEALANLENDQQQVSLHPTFYRTSSRLNSISVSSQTPINPRELITTILQKTAEVREMYWSLTMEKGFIREKIESKSSPSSFLESSIFDDGVPASLS